MHVDAASGGFVAPFVEPDLIWDFRIPRVRSINASGHKYGLAPLGVGWVVWRENSDLPEDLIFYVNYLGGNMPTFALNFSRPGGQIISQYYLFLRLGREGYRRIQQNGYDTAQYIAREIRSLAHSRFYSTATVARAFQPFPGRSKTVPILATRCSICPIGCACGAGKSQPIRCCRTSSTSW